MVFDTCEEDEKLPRTRTGVYKTLHESIVKKAAHRMKRPIPDIEKLLTVLSEIAFKMWRQELSDLPVEDLASARCTVDEVLQLGYIVRGDSDNLRFVHQTFMEFLVVVLYIEKMETEERKTVLNELHAALNPSLVKFLFGALSEKPLLEAASILIPKNKPPLYASFECNSSHLLLQCLSEVSQVTSELAEIIAPHSPWKIVLTPSCPESCFAGSFRMLSHYECMS
jgi:hypothetical protein